MNYLFLVNRLGTMLTISMIMIFSYACGFKQASSKAMADSDPEWETGVALYSFNKSPFPQSLEKSKMAGAAYVEGYSFHQLGPAFGNKTFLDLDAAGLDAVKRMISENKLEMPSLYLSAKSKEEYSRYFEIGKELGIDFFVSEPAWEDLDMVDSLAGVFGIKVAIHEHARGKSLYWHPDSVLTAIQGHPNFMACGDIGHWVRSGLDPVECLSMLEGHLLSIHAKDLDESGNIAANDVKVGTGVIDYEAVLGELRRQEFDGFIYVECEHDFEDNLEDVKSAVEYFKKN
jgi:sugar phosphate isomerase/epimerase